MPLRDRAKEGRVNAKGIPCLYLSDDKDTAMGEVRPWVGSYLSLAQFKILRKMDCVDFSVDGKPQILFGDEDGLKCEEQIWAWVDRAFSEPVTPSDDLADYAPTQIIAEAFRMKGYGGIAFKSSLGKGKNIALFNPADADLINCTLFRVEAVNFKFEQAGNTYYVTKHYPDIAAKVPEAKTPVMKIVDFLPADEPKPPDAL